MEKTQINLATSEVLFYCNVTTRLKDSSFTSQGVQWSHQFMKHKTTTAHRQITRKVAFNVSLFHFSLIKPTPLKGQIKQVCEHCRHLPVTHRASILSKVSDQPKDGLRSGKADGAYVPQPLMVQKDTGHKGKTVFPVQFITHRRAKIDSDLVAFLHVWEN